MNLKEATKIKHKTAEQMPFNIRMIKGEISKNDYLYYLIQQFAIFKTIEDKGLPHPSLSRKEKFVEDINELTQNIKDEYGLLPATIKYVDYLKSLNYEEVLPHIYLNYLALMFGGQMIKKMLPTTGNIYNFDNFAEAMQSIRNIQKDEWADEVNKGFDYIIKMFDELEKETLKNY
jgi:heme oxygenase